MTHRPRHRDAFGLIGWLFADLTLVLAMLFSGFIDGRASPSFAIPHAGTDRIPVAVRGAVPRSVLYADAQPLVQDDSGAT